MKIKKFKKIKKKSKILVKAKLIAQQVENNREEYSALSIEDLRIRTDYLVDGLAKDKFTLEDIIVDALSIAREIIYREHGMLAYEVQMMGAYVVHTGDFAEMYTGEGKSLTLLLVSFVNALTKRGVHIVTVNEYLVERDALFAQKAFEKLGITVGYNTSKLSKATKKEMFARDITYTTNSELGFDYLKDNMVRDINEKVIRELFFVIVDEADSVLIDEARTPLIISGQPKEDFSLYLDIDKFVGSLAEDDYKIDNESNTIALTDQGVSKAEKFFNLTNLYSVESAEIVHKITNSLVAHYIFANGKEYLVKDDKIYLVDQFTGRVLEGRSYNAGLQQAIQAKERVTIEPENVVMATITYQSFFRLYEKLSGVSGTAMTEAEEFLKIYNMVVVRIPTNKPVARIDKQDYIFGTKRVKWNHVIQEIVNRHETGQPILVGTASVTDSEIIHERLTELKIPHEVLNARDNTKEAEIVKHAGEKGAITISTNMAGRGTDIKVSDEIRELGGLYVIGTERHESRRIDNQLRGRTGRQGDPGESRFFTSLEDALFKRFATDRFEKASQKLEEEFYDSRFFSKMLDRTQKKVEGLNFDIRKNLMDYDHVLSLQRELIYKQRDQILLKTNNLNIINNMIDDYVETEILNFKNNDNTSLVDANKIVAFLNEKILKFSYFTPATFANMPILLAIDKAISIIKKVVDVKCKILEKINGLNVIDEILLVNLDQKWTTHIDKMTKLREGVNLRSLEQRSPLNIYIEDGNNLFERMKINVVTDTITSICNLSLPNEMIEITNALDEFVNSEEFKKKNYGNQREIEQNFNSALSFSGSATSEFDNFIESELENTLIEETPEEYVEVEEYIPQQTEPEVVETETTPYGFEIPKYDTSGTDKYELNNGSSEVNILENESDIFENSFSQIQNTFNTEELDPQETPHTAKADDQFVFESANLEDDIEEIENVSNIDKAPEIQQPLSEEEIQKILDMPAFKDDEKPLTIGNYLDNILDSMDIDYDQDKEITQQLEPSSNEQEVTANIPEQNQLDITTSDIDNEIELLDESERESIKEEIQKSISFDLSNDPDFIEYRNSVFVNKNNGIDYSDYKKLNEDESDDDIKAFYKLPKVDKKEPGTLFGGNLLKKTPFNFKNKNELDNEKIKSTNLFREENQASEQELNTLLQLDDEKDRLEKINQLLNKEDPEVLERKELERQVEFETPVYYLEDIPEGESLDNFKAMDNPHEEQSFEDNLVDEENQQLEFEEALDEVIDDGQFNDEVEAAELSEEVLEEVINPNPEELSEEDKWLITKKEHEKFMEKYLGDVKELTSENPEVVTALLQEKNKNLKDVEIIENNEELENTNEEEPNINSQDSFLNNIKIIKTVDKESEDETEIIQEINQPAEIHNLQKDILDYLKENNKK
ncbi:preprotein translocase subunit SecA [Malacoplasma penetrans]|nr:preprotein translocase subunit SecA [Malacoplasma penetrans]RXY96164.1 preprotein translocase subunit SecA [Malacoplasma penetrans]